jgi:hypothetical protein
MRNIDCEAYLTGTNFMDIYYGFTNQCYVDLGMRMVYKKIAFWNIAYRFGDMYRLKENSSWGLVLGLGFSLDLVKK